MKKNRLQSISASITPYLLLASSPLLVASNAIADPADQVGPYVSGYVGGFKSRGGDFEDENSVFDIGVGYRFLPFVSAELSYTNFGEYGNDFASAELDGYKLSAVGILPLTEKVELYGEVGQFFSNVDVELVGFESDYDDETLFFGVGIGFQISDPLWVNIEYQRYKVDYDTSNWPVDIGQDDTDIDTLKAGLAFYF